MTPERREQIRGVISNAKTSWRQSWKELLWTFGALNDNGQPSAALFFAMAVAAPVIRHLWKDALAGTPFDGWDVAMVGVVAAILFGSKMFMAWLNTKQLHDGVTRPTAEVHAQQGE